MNEPDAQAARFTVSRISRSRGALTVALAAQRHATRMRLPSGKFTVDYGNDAHHVTHSEIALPPDAPAWAAEAYGTPAFHAALAEIADGDRFAWARLSERLWNDIEHVETSRSRQPFKALLARDVVGSLPRMLSPETHVDLVQGFVQDAIARHRTVVDCTIRNKGHGKPLAFMMFPTRRLADDAWGGRAWRMHPYRLYMDLRATWKKHVNQALEHEGVAERLEETEDGRRLCLMRTGRDSAPRPHTTTTGTSATTIGDQP